MSEAKTLTPEENALDSLRRVAAAFENQNDVLLTIKSAIAWGWHAVGLLAYVRLRPGKERFDAWVQDYLHEGSPELNIERDARWEERERLSFLELLDILSEENMSSVKPDFYQGWQDRSSRCRWLRKQTNDLIGASITDEQREKLLLLLAVYHRLMRLPALVSLEVEPIIKAFPALLDVAKMLVDVNSDKAQELLTEISKCKEAAES